MAQAGTYYDSDRGANLIVITPDANRTDVLWDLELDSRRSFYFSPSRAQCEAMEFPVGILTRDWLHNATYLGVRPCPFASSASRRCAAWTKADFIDYYADASTCEPSAWWFHSMRAWFVTTAYAVNASAPAGYFTPPPYCNATV